MVILGQTEVTFSWCVDGKISSNSRTIRLEATPGRRFSVQPNVSGPACLSRALAASIMKIVVGIMLGCALGFAAHFVLSKQLAIGKHWKAVHRYNEFVGDPSNYEPDVTTGLSATTPPGDIQPDLES